VVQTPAGGRSPGCVAERCESGGTVYRRSANAPGDEKLLVDENAERRDRERYEREHERSTRTGEGRSRTFPQESQARRSTRQARSGKGGYVKLAARQSSVS
jgi:hypothetical protein